MFPYLQGTAQDGNDLLLNALRMLGKLKFFGQSSHVQSFHSGQHGIGDFER